MSTVQNSSIAPQTPARRTGYIPHPIQTPSSPVVQAFLVKVCSASSFAPDKVRSLVSMLVVVCFCFFLAQRYIANRTVAFDGLASGSIGGLCSCRNR